MPARLYVLEGSHPCATAECALAIKGLPYKRVELVELAHVPIQRLRFGGPTVPGLIFEDGHKVLGSRPIVHALERRMPEPPLFPLDPPARSRVEALERFGDAELQPVARRICWAAFRHDARPMASYVQNSKWPMPESVLRAVGPAIARGAARLHGADDSQLVADVRAVASLTQRVNAAIEAGEMGGDRPNAADLQIAPSVRLLLTFEDLRPMIEGSPAAELGERLFPMWPGRSPVGTIPAWALPEGCATAA